MTLDNPLWNQLDEFRVPEVEVVNNRSKDTLWTISTLHSNTSQVHSSPTHAHNCRNVLTSSFLPPPPKPQYTIYTDIDLVKSFLTHPAFHISSSRKKADILWLCDHFKRFRWMNQANVSAFHFYFNYQFYPPSSSFPPTSLSPSLVCDG